MIWRARRRRHLSFPGSAAAVVVVDRRLRLLRRAPPTVGYTMLSLLFAYRVVLLVRELGSFSHSKPFAP